MVPRAGDGDAEGVEVAEEEMCGDSGIQLLAIDVSAEDIQKQVLGSEFSQDAGTRSSSSSVTRAVLRTACC